MCCTDLPLDCLFCLVLWVGDLAADSLEADPPWDDLTPPAVFLFCPSTSCESCESCDVSTWDRVCRLLPGVFLLCPVTGVSFLRWLTARSGELSTVAICLPLAASWLRVSFLGSLTADGEGDRTSFSEEDAHFLRFEWSIFLAAGDFAFLTAIILVLFCLGLDLSFFFASCESFVSDLGDFCCFDSGLLSFDLAFSSSDLTLSSFNLASESLVCAFPLGVLVLDEITFSLGDPGGLRRRGFLLAGGAASNFFTLGFLEAGTLQFSSTLFWDNTVRGPSWEPGFRLGWPTLVPDNGWESSILQRQEAEQSSLWQPL